MASSREGLHREFYCSAAFIVAFWIDVETPVLVSSDWPHSRRCEGVSKSDAPMAETAKDSGGLTQFSVKTNGVFQGLHELNSGNLSACMHLLVFFRP